MDPSPLPILGRKRAGSITMPGSLFPRSPSLDLDPSFVPLSSGHVRFAQLHARPEELQPKSGPSRHDSIPPSSSPPTHSPVKAAIQRFDGDKSADPSMLLPISPRSPSSRNRAKGTRPCLDKSPTSFSSEAKGKQRAVDLTNEEDDFLEPGISGDTQVRGKEHELKKAIQQQLENETRRERQATEEPADFNSHEAERERERDKERILQLEEEIRLLKEEVRLHCFSL